MFACIIPSTTLSSSPSPVQLSRLEISLIPPVRPDLYEVLSCFGDLGLTCDVFFGVLNKKMLDKCLLRFSIVYTVFSIEMVFSYTREGRSVAGKQSVKSFPTPSLACNTLALSCDRHRSYQVNIFANYCRRGGSL